MCGVGCRGALLLCVGVFVNPPSLEAQAIHSKEWCVNFCRSMSMYDRIRQHILSVVFIYQSFCIYEQNTSDIRVNILCWLKFLINVRERSLFWLNILKSQGNPSYSLPFFNCQGILYIRYYTKTSEMCLQWSFRRCIWYKCCLIMFLNKFILSPYPFLQYNSEKKLHMNAFFFR